MWFDDKTKFDNLNKSEFKLCVNNNILDPISLAWWAVKIELFVFPLPEAMISRSLFVIDGVVTSPTIYAFLFKCISLIANEDIDNLLRPDPVKKIFW